MEVSILDGYGFINESATITNSYGRIRKNQIINATGLETLVIKGKVRYIRDLMIEAFFPDFNKETDEIFFIDGNKSNTKLSNLKVIPKVPCRKMSGLKVEAVRTLLKEGYTYSQIAELLQLSKVTIKLIDI